MKKLIIIAAASACAFAGVSSPAFARTLATGVTVSPPVANPDNSVTLNWSYEHAGSSTGYPGNTYSFSHTIDGATTYFDGLSKQTSLTSPALLPGTHTFKITVIQIFHTNSYLSSARCNVSSLRDYIWICSWTWDDTVSVTIAAPPPPPARPAPVLPPATPVAPVAPVAPDTVAPRLKALKSGALPGTTARLRYTVADNKGRTREQIIVRSNGKQVGTVIKTSLRQTSAGTVYGVRWRVPKQPGRWSFCVRAYDALGNFSSLSCAPLVTT